METKKKYWLSLKDWAGSPEFKAETQREFLNPLPEKNKGCTRREFLQIMGASLALGASGCFRRPAENIVPYVNRPDDVIPGEPNFYASSFYDQGEGFSIVVKTREGRPIKIEGNEEAQSLNGFGLSPRAQSHVLSLYDPERLKQPQRHFFNKTRTNKEVAKSSYKKADEVIVSEFKKGKGVIVTSNLPSPSTQKLINHFKTVFNFKHYDWNSLERHGLAEGQRLCYGSSIVPDYNISKAQFIFSLNCDFLGTYLSPVEFQKQFAETRKPSRKMSRLVVLESLMSLTGSNADERHRIRPADQMSVVMALTYYLSKEGYISLPSAYGAKVRSYKPRWEILPISQERWSEWAKYMGKNKGKSLILYGSSQGRNKDSEALHVAVNFLNSALGNDGRTVSYRRSVHSSGDYEAIDRLISDLNSGRVKRVLFHKVNPLYSYPQKDKLEAALRQAEFIVYTGDRVDETGHHADYIIPDSHDLEKWGDWEFKKGVFSIQQPTIRSLYDTRAFEDSLIQWIKMSGVKITEVNSVSNFYQYLKNYWVFRRGLSFWNQFLEKGVFEFQKNATSASRPVLAGAFNKIPFSHSVKSSEYELALYETSGLKDGTLANVSWLQEFPDPVTKICWDNYLCLSPKDALQEKLKEGNIVTIKVNNKELEVPIHIQPGQCEGVLGLALGYGRTNAGKVGNGVGQNAYPFMRAQQTSGLNAQITKTKKHIYLANVQGHHSMEGRDIILETTLNEYLKDPSSGIPHHHKIVSMWPEHKYKSYKWGMTIDLNSCNGCGSCMIACQSENNIPTVGKEYVLQGREMHWIRVDRYYEGKPESPEAVHQPVVCMHCDNAPCETVCPVMATVHSDEGTNDMIYNRCVGTRYCSNNCPYKVRRFNWFDYTKKQEEPLNMALNPEVTVRSRGVMEKCTFCIQRVKTAKAQAKKENRGVRDGGVQTACQQSCPAQAITFGDLNNDKSKVHQEFNSKNSYGLLDPLLNTKPAVKYRTKIRNRKPSESKSNKGHH